MRLRLLILLLGLPLTAAADAQKPFVGPVAATGLKNGATLTYDGNTQVALAADGRMALGNGKTVWIQNVAIADTTRVYWAPTQMGLSLDNRDVSVGERVTYDRGRSDLAHGVAVFSGTGFLSTQSDPHQAVDIRLYMEVRDDATNSQIVLVEVPELPTGVAVPLQNNRRHRIRLLYQVRVGDDWKSAYDHFNSINNSGDVGSAYTFAHGFFYDAAPKGVTLSKANVDENTAAGLIATISVTDANPVTASTTFTLVPGSGPNNNANFNIPAGTANLRSNRAFDFEIEPTQKIVIEAKNDYGTLDVPFTISINDVNETPTALALSNNSVNENAPTGTVIGTLSTTDPDTASAFRTASFAFTSPPADGFTYSNGLFSIDGASLKTAQVFDYENTSFPNGVYHIYVTATDGTGLPSAQRRSFTGRLSVQINNRNDPPVAQSVALSVLEDATLNLPWDTFRTRMTDQDLVTYPNTLSQVVVRSLPTKGTLRYHDVAATEIGYTQAMFAAVSYRGAQDFNGTDTFNWAAYDGQDTGPAATVTISVTPVNDAPSFDALPNITIDEDSFNSTARVITLSNLKAGPDNESQQTIAISGSVVSVTGAGSTNGLIQNPAGSGSTFQFRTVPDGYGSAVVRVTAKDNGGVDNNGVDTFSREFTVTINPVDDPPTKIADIPAQTFNENDAAKTIDLSGYFKDIDSPLTFVVTRNTKDAGSGNAIASLVSATISGSTLTLTPTDYSYGTGVITVEARGADMQNPSTVRTISSTFTLQVLNVDNPPVVGSGAAASLVYNEDAGTVTVPLDDWFTDPDLDTFSGVSVDLASINPSFLSVTDTKAALTGTQSGSLRGTLTLAFLPNVFTAYTAADGSTGNGTTSVRVTATANGRSVGYTVPITLNEINDPPTLALIGDQLIDQGTQPHYVALTGIGPGPGEAAIDHVVSVTAAGGAAGILDSGSIRIGSLNLANGTAQLTYTLQPFKYGADTITVTVTDARGGVTAQTFTVKANHVNQAPRPASPLPAPFINAPQQNGLPLLTFLEDQVGATIDASTLFWDPDADTIRQSIFANTVPSLLSLTTPAAASGTWNLTLLPDQNGTTNVILRATDGFLTSDFPFSIAVTPVNDPPTLDPIANQRVNQGAAPRTIALTGLGPGPANESDQTLVAVTPTVVETSVPNLITSLGAMLPVAGGGSATGSLSFGVSDTLSGTATIRVTIQDSGGTANGGIDTAWREFTVTVNPVDDAPTRQRAAGTITVLEDQFAGTNYQTTFDLTGNFADRARDPITLRLIQITDTADVLDNETPGRVVVPPGAPESIVVTFKPDANGTAAITYGATAKGLNSTDTDLLTIAVTPVNDPPRMRPPSPLVVPQGRVGPYTVTLRDISPGPADEAAQLVSVTNVAVISQSVENLIASATIVDGSPPALSFTISPTLAGTATLRVTLRDNGGTEHGGIDTAVYDVPVTVSAVDSPPARTGSFPDQVFLEDQFANNRYETTLDLTGVFTDPDGDPVALILTSSGISDPKNILDDEDRLVVVDGSNPQRINVTFRPDTSGEATLTVGAAAGTLTSPDTFSFKITVQPVNDAPTFGPISNLSLTADAGPAAVALTGISPGPADESDQRVTSVTASVASSSTPGLIDPASLGVVYSPGATTGTLSFATGAGLTGTATIAVTAQDDGGTANGGVDTFTRQFLVTVVAADRPPVLKFPKGTVTFSEDDFPGNGTNIRQIDLTGVFEDPDHDAISIVINSINDPDNILSDRDVAVDTTNPQVLNVPIIANTFGTATIRYRAVAKRQLSAAYDELTIVITPSNDAPRLNAIADQTVHEDSVPPIVLLTGISPGANENPALLSVTASIVRQSPADLIQNLTVHHTAPASTGSLSYTLGQDLTGQALVRVTVNDGEGLTFSRQFDIFVIGADDPPSTRVAADSYTLLEDQRDDGGNTVAIPYAGVFVDPENDPLTLLVQGVADDPAANVVDDERGGVFVADGAPLSLQLRLNPDANGSFTVTTGAHAGSRVTGTPNVRTFTVLPVNDAPTATLPDNRSVTEGSAPLVLQIANISPGPANESAQTVTAVTAAVDGASTAGLIASVATDYTPGATTATVTVAFVPRVSGTAQINVTLRDDGGTANGGQDTALGSFLINVTPVADPPELVSGREETFVAFSTDALPANRVVEIDLHGIFVDHDGDPIQLVLNSVADPEHILEDDAPGGLVFSPNDPQKLRILLSPDSYGEAVIGFQALAGGSFSSASATLRLLLTPPRGVPSFDPIAPQTIVEGTVVYAIDVRSIRGGLPPPDPATVQTLTAEIVSASPANLFAAIAPGDVDYTVGAPAGTVRVRPAPRAAGTATLRITVTDNGTASAARAVSFSQDVALVVSPQDDPPEVVGTFTPPLINEDQFLATGGITRLDFKDVFADADGDPISVRITQLDDPDNVLDNENGHTATDPLDPQKIMLAFHENAFGQVTFNVVGVAKGVSSIETVPVTIKVEPVNDAPTLAAIPAVTITQKQNEYSVPLSGISVGPANESDQTIIGLTATVVQTNPANLLTGLSVTPPSSGAATLTFGVGARFGTAIVQVAVQDDGGTLRNGQDTFTRQFAVNVNIADRPPVLVQPVSPLALVEDQFAGSNNVTTVSLAGNYVDPDGDDVSYVLGAIVDADDVLADEQPGAIALSGANNATLKLTLRPNAFGSATVRYRASSRGLLAPAFDTLQINVAPVNDAPRFDIIGNVTVPAGSGEKIVTIAGLSVGPREGAVQAWQSLAANVMSGAAVFAAAPTVTLDVSGRTATLRFTPSDNAGSATVQVVARDNGGTELGGVDTFARTFVVTVTAVDHPPVAAGAAPSYHYAEDEFAGANYVTTETLPALFTDPDGDAVTLLLGAISDPHDVLDNESGRVRLLPGNVLQLAFVPDAHGVATVPIFGFANGRKSDAPQLVTVTVDAVNDAPLVQLPQRLLLAPEQTRVSLALELQSPGPKEDDQRFAAIDATWVTHGGDPVPCDAPAFLRAGAVPLDIELPGGANFLSGTLRISVRDNGGTAGGGVDSVTRDLVLARAPEDRPWHNAGGARPDVRAATLGGVAGLVLDFSTRFGAPDRWTLVPLELFDAEDRVDLPRSGVLLREPTKLFLALRGGASSAGLRLTYTAAANGRLAATAETFEFRADGTVPSASAVSLLTSELPPRPILDGAMRAWLLGATSDGNDVPQPLARWAWSRAGNDSGFGAVPAPEAAGTFTAAALQVPFTDGDATTYVEVSRSAFVRRMAEVAEARRVATQADDDADGIPALMEYLMGLDPTQRESGVLYPSVVHEGGKSWIEVRYSRMKARLDGVLQLERLGVHGRWVPDDTAPEIIESNDESDLLRVRYPLDGGQPVLFRFRAARAE